MKKIVCLFPLGVAFLVGCDATSPDSGSSGTAANSNPTNGGSTTSGGSTSSGGTSGGSATSGATHDPALVGTWWLNDVSTGTTHSYADSVKINLKSDGTYEGNNRYTEWIKDSIVDLHICANSGTWHSTSSKIYVQYTSSCSILEDGKSSTETHSGLDTSAYSVSGTKLTLISNDGVHSDTSIFTKG